MPSLICSYNGCLELMLRLISEKPDRYMIIVATHNEESVRQAVTRYTCVTDEPLLSAWSWVMLIGVLCLCFSMEHLGLLRDAGAVCFGQLLGMCDHVSLTLGKKLYCVCVHVLGRHPQVLFCSQRSTVSRCISLCRTARWRTRCRIWCAGLRRTAACSRESVRNEICSDWSCAADSERRSQVPDKEKST